MKNIIFGLICVFFTYGGLSAQVELPQPSPSASVSTVVGLNNVRIDYYRPRTKGRKIFGDGEAFLVPYGKIWRTGANNGTKISFSDDVVVQGINVPKGEYLIFTWPGVSEWTISLYKDLTIGGNTSNYDIKNEVAKFKVRSEKLPKKLDMLTFSIDDLSDDGKEANIQIGWENTSVKFHITADYDSRVMKSIEQGTQLNPNNLINAARYYYDTNRDLDQALRWTNEFLAKETKNPFLFFHLTFKAKLLKAMNKKDEARKTAQQAIDETRKANSSEFGAMIIKENEDLIKSIK